MTETIFECDPLKIVNHNNHMGIVNTHTNSLISDWYDYISILGYVTRSSNFYTVRNDNGKYAICHKNQSNPVTQWFDFIDEGNGVIIGKSNYYFVQQVIDGIAQSAIFDINQKDPVVGFSEDSIPDEIFDMYGLNHYPVYI